MTADNRTDAQKKTDAAAEALREHWNKVKATSANPGDRKIADLLGTLLEALAAEREAGAK